MKRYDQATSTPGAVVSYRRIPTRAPTFQADFVVPALTGLFVGLFGGLFMALLFWLVFSYFWMPFAIFATTFVLGGFAARVWLNQGDISATEEIERMPGEPDAPRLEMPALPALREPILLNADVGRDQAKKEERNADRLAFEQFVQDCVYDTTVRRWKGEPMYARWRDILIAGNKARWRNDNNHNEGWVLNGDPDDIIATLSGQGS